MRDFVYVTGNSLKAERLSIHLKTPVPHQRIDLAEIQSLDVEEVVRHKAQLAHSIVGKAVLVEDYSVQIHSLGNLPGPLVKWFMQALGPQGICDLVSRFAERRATVQNCLGFCDGKETRTFLGERRGHIAEEPRGRSQWGPDMIFIPNGSRKTFSQMNEADLVKFSVRAIAIRKFEEFLRSPHG
jgi:XTP/dITP diphosphohydrolase